MVKITNQTFEKPEKLILDWLRNNGSFFDSQKVLAKEIGYSRWTTNFALRELEQKGLLTIKQTKNLYKSKRVVELTTEGAK